MSTINDTHAAHVDTCPSWCVAHIRPDDVDRYGVRWGGDTTLHMGTDVRGETAEGQWVTGYSLDGSEPATVDAYADGQMTTAQARAFAAAIVAVCDLLEGAQR